MRRGELEHILRAASRVLGERDLLVIGSASILGTFPESVLPSAATRSDEADIASFSDEDGAKSTQIDGAIGELSPFHRANGYYGQGVDARTAKLPPGWRDRLILYRNRNTTPGRGLCLERHDCIASKLAAFRDKDREFADALFAAGLADASTVRERVAQIEELDPKLREVVLAWLDARLAPMVGRKLGTEDSLDELVGILPLPPGGTDAFIREIRGPGPDEDSAT
jgi:hypothetical protein